MGNGELSRGDRTWVIYRGPDGSRFWLAGMRGQGKFTGGTGKVEWARGVVGLDRPPTELVWLQEARQNGADLVGNNVDVRTISAAVNILGRTPREMRDAFAAWRRANQFDRLGRLFFVNSYSGVRYSDVLLGDAPSGSLDTDPALLRRFDGYPYKWVAPNPYYKGYPEEFEWTVPSANPFGVSEGTLRLRNLGDAYTYPVIKLPGPGTWQIPMGTRGPGPNGEEGFGELTDDVITIPEINADEFVWLNTDPRVETITYVRADGREENLWAKMSGQRPRIKLLGDRAEDWRLSVKGGPVGAKAKFIVQPLYTTFI